MGKKAFHFVEIMIVAVIIVLFVAIIIPSALKSGIEANDTLAKGKLRQLSAAAEAYATTHTGNYPLEMTALSGTMPPLTRENPCGLAISGFRYACEFTAISYVFTAIPVTAGKSGTAIYTITTGGVLQ